MSKEKMKTVFLALLFVLSVLLTQRLWIIIPSGEAALEEPGESREEELNIYAEILSPQSYVYNFGGGYHTVLFTDPNGTWEEAIGRVDRFVEKDFTVETLNLTQWQEINEYKSVKLRFSFPIPLELFYGDYESWALKEILQHVDYLVLPASEPNILYVADKSRGIYLRLRGEGMTDDISAKIDEVARMDVTDYFRAGDILGIDSDLLLPINFEKEVPSLKVAPEIGASDQTQITAIAGRFFGENFDFVKRLEENDGSVLYISNYGEKVMKIYADGLLEYTEKLEKQGRPSTLSKMEALNKAVVFVRNYGGWPVNAYLSNLETIEKSGMPGYRLLFNYKMKGYPVLTASGEGHGAISVEIYGNTIGYYKRKIIREKMNPGSEGSVSDGAVLVPQKVIDRNLSEIAAAYIIDNGLDLDQVSKDQLLFDILSAIENIQLAYYLDDFNQPDTLSPIWKINIDQRLYYFHARDGKILYRISTE